MFPPRWAQPPCRNIEVNSVGQKGSGMSGAMSWTGEDWLALQAREDLDRGAGGGEAGGPDEHPAHGRVERRRGELRLERLRLTAVRVPLHGRVEEAEARLGRLDLAREQDGAGAGAE